MKYCLLCEYVFIKYVCLTVQNKGKATGIRGWWVFKELAQAHYREWDTLIANHSDHCSIHRRLFSMQACLCDDLSWLTGALRWQNLYP